METSSGTNFQNQQTPNMIPSRQQPRPGILKTSLSFSSIDANGSPNLQEPRSNSDPVHEFPSEIASSRETFPTTEAFNVKRIEKEKEGENKVPDISVIHRVSISDKMSLHEVARERVDIVSDRMKHLPDDFLEGLKNELRSLLDGTGGSQRRDEFLALQKLVQNRGDLTEKTMIRAHRAQLEILVAIKSGIQAFLHPSISLSQSLLIEVFVYRRCRNIACQSQIPADECTCEICTNRNGFCNLCMCVICNKFDFEVNTCRWIGCDFCSHWTHTDCAIRDGHIGMGSCVKSGMPVSEMIFRCRACNRTSQLMGWVKDVFQHCAPSWDRDALIREIDYVTRIFRGSEDSKGRKLFWKCEELIEKMKGGAMESAALYKLILLFFKELEVDSSRNRESEGGRLIAPQEACNRIADVVQEAIRKMESVADEKMRICKKARLALDACDRELEDKAKEVTELKLGRQRKKQQLVELEKIVRLKQAEADMFQLKASEARREAERLHRIALAKTDKSEEEYASRYLEMKLNEAEAEKQYLFEKIKIQEGSRASQRSVSGNDNTQIPMFCKIQEMLKNVYNAPSNEDQTNGLHSLGSIP